MTVRTPKPGEVYFADIGDPDKRRVIILSREELNRGNHILVVPVTKARFEERSLCRNCVPFRAGQYSFSVDCVAQGERVAFLRKALIELEQGPLDTLDAADMRALIKAVGYAMDADCELGAL